MNFISHTLDEIEGWACECIFAKYPAASLQTLAEKIANTIYRAAKVCSYQSAYADNITDISWQRYIHLLFFLFI